MPLLGFGSVFLLTGLATLAAADATIPEEATTITTTMAEGEFRSMPTKPFRLLMSIEGEGDAAPMPVSAMSTNQGLWGSWSRGSNFDIKPVRGWVEGLNRGGRRSRREMMRGLAICEASLPTSIQKHTPTRPNAVGHHTWHYTVESRPFDTCIVLYFF